MDFTSIQHGTLEEGTETPMGVIEAVSLTAYMIAGAWVPFRVIHGPYKRAAVLTEGLLPYSWEVRS